MTIENTAVSHEEPDTTHPIQILLHHTYGNTFANRGRNTEYAPVRVDDLKATDVDWLLPRLTVVTTDHDEDEFTLVIDDAILIALDEEQLCRHGATIQQKERHTTYHFHICLSELDSIRVLARAIKAVTAKGQAYFDKNLCWICPRTAKSLYGLADELEELAPDQGESSDFALRSLA